MRSRMGIVAFGITTSIFLGGLVFAYQFNFGSLVETASHQDNVSFGSGRQSTFLRREVQIPKAYGRLVTITGHDERTMLWFESDNGLIRNVELDGADPVIIQRMGELR